MIPVVIVPEGGVPVTAVETDAPVLTESEHGGLPITLVEGAAPFIVQLLPEED